MAFWLIKSEPLTWSWTMQKEKKITAWDGVRNYQAANNLKSMDIGDLVFFYQSVTDKKIMGVVDVVKTYYPDPTDATGRFGMVDVRYVAHMPEPVTLATIKAHPQLAHLGLIKQSRLSVMPIDQVAFKIICEMGKYV